MRKAESVLFRLSAGWTVAGLASGLAYRELTRSTGFSGFTQLAVVHTHTLVLGTIVGLPGQSLASLADDVLLASRLGASMTSASPFVPAPATPLAATRPGDIETTLNVLAVMRLVNPCALIPTVSALETLAPGAQVRGLAAGANVITVNFSPEQDQARYPIYGRRRFIVRRDHAFRTLEAAGLEPLLGAAASAFWAKRKATTPVEA